MADFLVGEAVEVLHAEDLAQAAAELGLVVEHAQDLSMTRRQQSEELRGMDFEGAVEARVVFTRQKSFQFGAGTLTGVAQGAVIAGHEVGGL
ncbi:MAG: hypothetical protein BroJett014_30220 [Planctomycetota bacterium]|nr:MAG: hypothetical protein BroJett014_30220 [Planctomycetota bacterium]